MSLLKIASRFAKANLARENDIADFIEKTDINQKLRKINKSYFM